VPLIDVFGIMPQFIWLLHRPVVHAGPVAHVFGVLPAPHVIPVGHVPQLGVTLPQPSATTPQVAPACAQSRGVHACPLPLPPPPHSKLVPPPPHVSGDVQLPQSIWPPQPSPIGPHIAFWAEHELRLHVALPLLPLSVSVGIGGPSIATPLPSSGAPGSLCVGPQANVKTSITANGNFVIWCADAHTNL